MTEILDAQQLADRLQIHVDQVRKLTGEGRIPHLYISPRLIRYNLDEVCTALRVAKHPDDDAVDTFAQALRDRMAEKREQGRNGWEHCDLDELGLRLLRSIADGDPIDVGNYAMMISTLGGGTEHVLEQHCAQVIYESRAPLVVVPVPAFDVLQTVSEAARAVVRAWQDEDGSIKEPMQRLAKELGR